MLLYKGADLAPSDRRLEGDLAARFLVLGSRGRLGRAFMEELCRRGKCVQGFDLPDVDIADVDSVSAAVRQARADVIFNAAAYTDVDGAETAEAAAARANAEGPAILAELAAARDALLVHVSTDYVFDGRKAAPYVEDDPPAPLNAYGRTKLAGEEAVRASGVRHLIVRSAWFFAPWGGSFVSGILSQAREGKPLRVVDDVRGSPTSVTDLAEAVVELALRNPDARDTYHVVNSGEASWRELAAAAVELAGLRVPVEPLLAKDAPPRPAARPRFSVLSPKKFERALGRPMRHWREALRDCISRMSGASSPP